MATAAVAAAVARSRLDGSPSSAHKRTAPREAREGAGGRPARDRAGGQAHELAHISARGESYGLASEQRRRRRPVSLSLSLFGPTMAAWARPAGCCMRLRALPFAKRTPVRPVAGAVGAPNHCARLRRPHKERRRRLKRCRRLWRFAQSARPLCCQPKLSRSLSLCPVFARLNAEVAASAIGEKLAPMSPISPSASAQGAATTQSPTAKEASARALSSCNERSGCALGSSDGRRHCSILFVYQRAPVVSNGAVGSANCWLQHRGARRLTMLATEDAKGDAASRELP